jgi:hypothetical protein
MLARNGFYTYATMHKLDGRGGSRQIIDIAKNDNLPIEAINWMLITINVCSNSDL